MLRKGLSVSYSHNVTQTEQVDLAPVKWFSRMNEEKTVGQSHKLDKTELVLASPDV